MASPWLWKHVIPHLQGPRHTPARIAEKFLEFCGNNPEFWGYYCAWDWWLVCKLFGGFMKLPPTWPAWCNDINTLHVLQKYTRWNPPKQTTANHHALNDAIWTRDAYNHLLDTACLTSP